MILKTMICQDRRCRWFRGAIGPSTDLTYVCMAFPLGIPLKIMGGKDRHDQPIPGDGGYIFMATPFKASTDSKGYTPTIQIVRALHHAGYDPGVVSVKNDAVAASLESTLKHLPYPGPRATIDIFEGEPEKSIYVPAGIYAPEFGRMTVVYQEKTAAIQLAHMAGHMYTWQGKRNLAVEPAALQALGYEITDQDDDGSWRFWPGARSHHVMRSGLAFKQTDDAFFPRLDPEEAYADAFVSWLLTPQVLPQAIKTLFDDQFAPRKE